MISVFLLFFTATLHCTLGQSLQRGLTAENGIYMSDFPSPSYNMGSGDNNFDYTYHNNYVSFPQTYNSGYHHSVPSTASNIQMHPNEGMNGLSNYLSYTPINNPSIQNYNNYGLSTTYRGSDLVGNGNFPISYSTHRPIIGGLHMNIGMTCGGRMNGMPIYLANGHIGSYNPYNAVGIIHPYK